jgi:PhnB protein
MLFHMEGTNHLPQLTPLLIVRGASHAIDFYVRAFGAREIARYVDRRTGAIRHADLALGSAAFSVTEEAPDWNSDAPDSLGGSPVVLQLRVEDVDAIFERACGLGAVVVFPRMEFCGERMGRVRDPFGHLWILSEELEALSPDEKQRRRDAWVPPTNSPNIRGRGNRAQGTRKGPNHPPRARNLATHGDSRDPLSPRLACVAPVALSIRAAPTATAAATAARRSSFTTG